MAQSLIFCKMQVVMLNFTECPRDSLVEDLPAMLQLEHLIGQFDDDVVFSSERLFEQCHLLPQTCHLLSLGSEERGTVRG